MRIVKVVDAAGFDDLLKSDVDGIILATPKAQHADQAIAALEHGKAVFCEKPLAVDAHETQLVVDVARGNCILLGVDLPHRHDPALAALRDSIASIEVTSADDESRYDLVDLALWMMRFPRVMSVSPAHVELAGKRTIRFVRGDVNQIAFNGQHVRLDSVAKGLALEAWTERLSRSKEFDDAVESIVDTARVVDAI
jgi:hypothetical protein